MADAEALFAAHQAGLLRYLSRIVGHQDTARDLTQDVFVRVAGSESLPESDCERRAWVFRIARNLAIDYQRRQRVRGGAAPVADSRQAAQHTTVAVREALGSLDAVDRDVFLMREVGGLSYVEIAAACDLSADAVRSRIHRARLRLREQLHAPIAAARRQPLRSRT